jgi:hypothetical protein
MQRTGVVVCIKLIIGLESVCCVTARQRIMYNIISHATLHWIGMVNRSSSVAKVAVHLMRGQVWRSSVPIL